MFGSGLLAVTLSAPLNFNMGALVWLGIAAAIFALVYFGGAALGKKVTVSQAVSLSARATNFLRHIDSLGLPFLAPLMKDVAEGNWAKIPGDVHTIFDQLDDKATRASLLGTLEQRRLVDRLAKPDDREKILQLVESQLGVKIPRSPESPSLLLEARELRSSDS